MDQSVSFDAELLKRYNKTGPRYTSYPTANRFHEEFKYKDLARCAQWSNEDLIPRPLSLYIHIPFCDTVCFYCGCNKVVTKDHTRAQPYIENLKNEAILLKEFFDVDRKVEQLHFGGGTPTFLSDDQLKDFMSFLRQRFNLLNDDQGEYSIEIDPRKLQPGSLENLRALGFNRLSFGIQDFNEAVQKAVNRIQTEAETTASYHKARELGYKSINFDLIYGLPYQSPQSFAETIRKTIDLRPDRIAVFNYAHLPHLFKPQRRINEQDLPSAAQKLQILEESIDSLIKAGYVYIGLDHFALPDDELAIAQRDGSLYRNFQGFSAHADCDLIALGVSAIGKVGDCYYQNTRKIDQYNQYIEDEKLPVVRGLQLNADDVVRRDLINQLICYSELDISQFERKYGLDFKEYFAEELIELEKCVADKLVTADSEKITVLPAGRLLVRNVAMIFDRYLQDANNVSQFSKVI